MKNFIFIPKSCNENWDAMTPKEQGRHCATCNIVVKDFTQMSNEKILAYLNKNKTRNCGRFSESQMVRKSDTSLKLRKFIFAFAFAFLTLNALPSEAQSTKQIIRLERPTAGAMHGMIKSCDDYGIDSAEVLVYKKGILVKKTTADIEGYYILNNLNEGQYEIVIKSESYKTVSKIYVNIKKQVLLFEDFKFSEKYNNGTLYLLDGMFVGSPCTR